MAKKRLPSGELERRVLDALWASGQPMTPGDVHRAIGSDRALAYTTVMTILTRLLEKGELTRRRHGRSFEYEPVVQRHERVAQRMGDVLDAAGDQMLALSTFVTSLPDGQRIALREFLETIEQSNR